MTPDDIIESGFAALRGAQSRRSPSELVEAARRQIVHAKLKKTVYGIAACLVVAGAFTIAMQPTSALASLRESARLTSAQPILHVRFDRRDSSRNPTPPLWPRVPTTDMWKFSDRYFRKHGYTLFEAFKSGKTLAYDHRFTEGFRSTYDAQTDRFWTFDGTILEELEGAHRNPPTVHDVTIHGDRFTDYEWQDTDGMQNKTTSNVYVDPRTKLVRFSDSDRTNPNGDTNHSSAVVEYPNVSVAERDGPRFPKGLKFRTAAELLKEFNHKIGRPDQSKTLGGIRTTLYGVVIYPNVPDGLGVEVITQGGAGPDFGSDHLPEVVGVPLLPVKRSAWFPPLGDPTKVRHGFFPAIGGREYIVNQSNDLLTTAPKRITIRVPVWRFGRSVIDHEGRLVHAHEFVGYETFTTSKLFYNVGDADFNFYQELRHLK